MNAKDENSPRGRFLRMEDVANTKHGRGIVGLSPATINRLHSRGQFPAKRRLSDRCVGWFESDIEAWKHTRQSVEQSV